MNHSIILSEVLTTGEILRTSQNFMPWPYFEVLSQLYTLEQKISDPKYLEQFRTRHRIVLRV